MNFLNLNKELQFAVEQAENMAIEYIRNNVSFSPSIFSGNKNIKKIISSSLDEGIEAAVEEIETMEEETVVLIYTDQISQVYNEDEDFGYSFGLLYQVIDNKMTFLNKRIFLGNLRNCLIF